ncbi:MAG: VCBS repeat-containing protein [Deltaproteobacteria bacterium]|nr:VCBS repeat-containing protein [Deltaproteobacteria bacterium]
MKTLILLTGLLWTTSAAGQDWPVGRHDPGRSAFQPLPAELARPAELATLRLGGRLDAGRLLAADLDLDGLPETVFARGGRILAVGPTGAVDWISIDLDADRPLGAADFDGDGRPDLLLATGAPGLAALDGSTDRVLLRSPAAAAPPGTVLPLDIDGDGTLELYVADDGCAVDDPAAGGRVYGFAGGVGGVRVTLRTETHDVWCGRNHVAADLDGDGLPELVAPDEDRVWAYDARSGFSTHVSPSLESFPLGMVDVAAADLDGDGDDELVLASNNASRRLASSRRLLVLEAEDGTLAPRWERRVPAEAGQHRYLDAPAADVLPDVPGLEIVTSMTDGAGSGWAVRVFRGLGADGRPDLLLELPGSIALGTADLDGDGADEIIARPAPDDAVPEGPAAVEAWRVGLDGEPERLWESEPALVPLLPDPSRARFARPDGWGAPAAPAVLPGPEGDPALLVARDADGDGLVDTLALLDGPTGLDLAVWTTGPGATGLPSFTALARASGGGAVLAAAADDGRVALFDASLTLLDDGNGDGLPDVEVADALPAPPVVARVAGRATTLAVDAGARPVAFPAPLRAGPDGALEPTARSAARATGDERAVVAAARCDGPAGFVPVVFATDAGGRAALALCGDLAPPPTLVSLGRAGTPLGDPLPFGDLDAAHPGWDAVAMRHVEEQTYYGSRTFLSVTSTGAAAPLWVGAEAEDYADDLLSAADLDGAGTPELLAIRGSFRQAVDAAGAEVVRRDGWGGGTIAAADIDGDGLPELFRTGSSWGGPERLDRSLDRVWIADEGYSHRGRYAALGRGASGTWRVAATAERSGTLSAWDATDGTLRWRTALAGGEGWPDEAAARAAGVRPGVLSSPTALASLDGDDDGAFLVGSSDHRLYAVRAADGSVAWSVALHAPVGEPIAADVEGDGTVRVLAPTSDGRIHVLGAAAADGPVEVRDGDGASDPETDLDELSDAQVVAASWTPVEGATGYLAAVTTADDVVVRDWFGTTGPGFVLHGVSLRRGTRYRTVVRAVFGPTARSTESSSDGFLVVDDDVPWVELTTMPARIRPERDGIDDVAMLRLEATDRVALRSWRVEVLEPDGGVRRELARVETGVARLAAVVGWDGRGTDGRVVAGGSWRVAAEVDDLAGHLGRSETTVLVCAGPFAETAACRDTEPPDADGDDGGSDALADGASEAGPPVPGGGSGCDCGVAGGGAGTAAATLAGLLAALALLAARATTRCGTAGGCRRTGRRRSTLRATGCAGSAIRSGPRSSSAARPRPAGTSTRRTGCWPGSSRRGSGHR